MTPFVAEIAGTFILILFGCGINANNSLNKTYGQGSGWVLISIGWGFAVFMGVVVAGPVSGAHLNPAVTLGLATAGRFAWTSVPMYILAQLIGAMLGAFTSWLTYRDHYNATESADTILGTFSTGPAIKNYASNFFSEAIGTFALIFVILFIVDAHIEVSGFSGITVGLGSVGALPVAVLVIVIGMALGGTTGYAINPARDLGPRIVHAIVPIANKSISNWQYSWVPVLGPCVGGIGAALVFLLIS